MSLRKAGPALAAADQFVITPICEGNSGPPRFLIIVVPQKPLALDLSLIHI